MRQAVLATGCYYHIYNRGVEKRKIFQDKWDYARFLETIQFYSLSPTPGKLSDFRRGIKPLNKPLDQKPLVKILAFCLMPNHFHFLIQQIEDNGTTKFLHRISDSYTKFFNTKYERVGHLLQGTFKAKLIEDDTSLLQISKYIHRNAQGIADIQDYAYSSYPFYLSNQTHPFCETDLIVSFFNKNNPNLTYRSFVEETEIDDLDVFDLLIDAQDH